MRSLGTAVAVVALLGTSVASGEPKTAPGSFSGPNGLLGAGLTLDTSQRARAYAEQSLFAGRGWTQLGWTLGAGYQALDHLEVELSLGVAGLSVATDPRTTNFTVGNLALSGNYVTGKRDWMLKVGGGVAASPWNQWDPDDGLWSASWYLMRVADDTQAYQQPWLWNAHWVHLYVPFRFEVGQAVRFTVDSTFNLSIPTLEGMTTDVRFQLAPGVDWRAAHWLNMGLRTPVHVFTEGSGNITADIFLASVEPYLRFNLTPAFVSTRFTFNLNEHLGPTFYQDGQYGWHVAVGASF